MRKLKKDLSTAQRIAISFSLVILVGSILLYLPITHLPNVNVSYIDALVIATSATCVTGLTPLVIVETFNILGKIVILLLIQIGGVGLITIMASFVLFLKNRISLKERHTLSEMLNRSDLFNFSLFVKNVVKFTLGIELLGAVLFLPVLIPKFGFLKGIGHSIFLSVSSFCNAGFDLFGSTSLIAFKHDLYFQFVVMALIVFGGIGFAVWIDFIEVIKITFSKANRKIRQKLSTHSKLVLVITAVLIVVPAMLFYLLEKDNTTFLGLNVFEIISASLFQSVTLRTAGFYTLDFSIIRYVTLLMMIPIMFIGGSSGGTAGGVKTTTMFVALSYLIATIRGQKELIILKRTISKEIVMKAFTLIFINAIVLLLSIILLSIEAPESKIMEYAFEAASALGTVGISTGITSTLTIFGKMIIILLMFVGRIGIVTLVFSMRGTQSKAKNKVGYPTGNIIVG